MPPPVRKPVSLTPGRLEMILESLRAGILLPEAARAEGVGSTDAEVRAYARENAEFCKAMMDAIEAGADARRAQPEAYPMPAPAKTPPRPVEPSTPVAWAPVVQASADATDPEDDEEPGDLVGGWAVARKEAAALAPGLLGTLLWIDARCQKIDMHALDPWWVEKLSEFYASGKMVFAARVGLRGGKSASICRALVNDALFADCDIDTGTKGVIPIMSSDRTEATDRFHTIKKILRACGVRPNPKTKSRSAEEDDESDVVPGGVGGVYTQSSLPSGGGVIKIEDERGRSIEFRIYPARISGAVGYTGRAGFADEVDLWPADLGVSAEELEQKQDGGLANPADIVLDHLLKRFTTTDATAHLYIVSASYFGPRTAHARKINEGDTSIQYLARLGDLGAARDEAARRALAVEIGSDDPRLLAPADPRGTDVGAWVSNPRKASISTCYKLSKERLRPMFGRYGGRPDEAEGGGELRDIAPSICDLPRRTGLIDAVIGVAPPEGGSPWGIVVVGRDASGIVTVMVDASARMDGGAAAERICALTAEHAITFAACAEGHVERVRAELGAHVSGRAVFAPPVAGVAIHDGPTLRVGPLRTLYQRALVRHVGGLQTLEEEAKGWTVDGPRAARLEALCAAVAWVALGGQIGGGEAWEMTPTHAPRGSIVVGRVEDRGGPPAHMRRATG